MPETVNRTATEAERKEQQKRHAAATVASATERATGLTERLITYAQALAKEQSMAPEELVFGAALYLVNLRETYPAGKTAFDAITASAADYYDANS